MKKWRLVSAAAMGAGLALILVSILVPPDSLAEAQSKVYYVREDAPGDCLSATTPCGSVQQALDLADDGDEILVATGTYTENLFITRGVRLRGGWNVSFTTQSPVSYPSVIDGAGAHVISATVESGPALIQGFTVRNGRDGIHLYAGTFTLTHNHIYSTAKQAIEVTTGTLWIEGNVISRAVDGGISINGGAAVISANLVHNVSGDSGDGIHTEDECSRVELHGNTVYSVTRDGIDAAGRAITLTGNLVHDTGKHGLYIRDAETAQARGNRVYETGERGIYARDCSPVLIDNEVHNTGEDGIYSHKSCADVEICDNIIYSVGDDGVDGRGATLLISGNVVTDSADNGIKSEQADYTLIEANQVYGVGDAGIDLDDAGAFTVTNNIIALGSGEPGATGVLIQTGASARNFLHHNTLVGGNAARLGTGISLTVGGVEVVMVNNIVVSHSVGISATAGAMPSVTHTLLWGNGLDPITGTGAITEPPRFVAPASWDYHLRPDSPAVDAGLEVGLEEDVDGDPRPLGARPDIGADEVSSPGEDVRVYLPLILRTQPASPDSDVVLYEIYAEPGDLSFLEQDPYRDETIPAQFVYGRDWEVELRYRGDVSRLMPKKCWKAFFPGSDLFQEQEELNLNADYPDQTLLRSYIGYDLFSRVGVPAPRADYARLNINDEYRGLFSQVEQIDERFLHRVGLDMHGNLYKPYYGNLTLEDSEWWYEEHYPKKINRRSGYDDLIEFIELINETPEEEFPQAIAEVLDVNEWIDWYAVNVLLGNAEMMEKNYYLYHAPLYEDGEARWIILPWDVDIALGHNVGPGGGGYDHLLDEEISWDNPIDTGADPAALYNHLIYRMMGVEEFRSFYCRRLKEIMADQFSPAEMFPRIDAAYEHIHTAAEADPHRWQPNGFQFSDGPQELKTYITNRIAFLEGEMVDFCPGWPEMEPPLALNELMVENSSTIADESGDYDPWIELHNRSATLSWDVGGMCLTHEAALTGVTTQWTIPDGTRVPPNGAFLYDTEGKRSDIIWADGEPGEGALHTSFALDAGGGRIALFDRDLFDRNLAVPLADSVAISVLTYTAQPTDTSYGRMPDGGENWQAFDAPTPGWLNQGRPPSITGATHSPTVPTSSIPITVTATITPGEAGGRAIFAEVVTATLWYRVFAAGSQQPEDYESAPMENLGGNESLYQAVLPAQPDGTWVEYYIEAYDEMGMRTIDRPGWPNKDYRVIVGWQRPPLFINELMALNTRTLEDEAGERDDWIELYNAGAVDIDLGGMHLSDNVGNSTQYRIPEGVVAPAGGYLLLWADGDGAGAHLNFRLSGAGEYVGLFDGEAGYYAPIDAAYFPPQAPDVSWGRFPAPAAESGMGDESAWQALEEPTPGASNRLHAPQFLEVTRDPDWPGAGESVTVTAVLTGGLSGISVTLRYDVGGGFQAIPMACGGEEGAAYFAQLPAQSEGTLVRYYFEALDGMGQKTLHLAGVPTVTHRYLVGYTPPPVVINEFLADNESVNRDEDGEYDDWVELYNAGAVTATLDGMYLTDDVASFSAGLERWQFAAGTAIPPGGYLLVWCDRDTEQGALHADFKLDADGEEIGLFAADAHGSSTSQNVPLDFITFGPQQEDISYGRRPDGAETWGSIDPPTPGVENGE
jgi:hypothetical protein